LEKVLTAKVLGSEVPGSGLKGAEKWSEGRLE
jgi:hypothetical protein